MKLQSCGVSDVGRVRDHNEDCCLENHRLGLFIVADGMGGHNAGEIASRLAVDVLSAEVHRHQKLAATFAHGPTPRLKVRLLAMLDDAVQRASRRIHEAGVLDPAQQGMATTLSALWLVGQTAFIAHVGDSRIYLIRQGEIRQLTQDHTLIGEQLRRGLITPEDLPNLTQYRGVITRAVGLMPGVEADIVDLDLLPGDRFLLCSDGLYETVRDEEILQMFTHHTLDDVAQRLVALANARGGEDNLTALALALPDLPLADDADDVDRKMEALRQIPLFERLSYSELLKCLGLAQLENRRKGDILARQGDVGDRLCILLRGSVHVLRDDLYLTTLQRGDHFGEISLVDNGPHSATIRAAMDCDLLCIDRGDFYHLLQEEPHLSVKILLTFVGVLSGKLRDTTRAFSEWRRRSSDGPAPSA